MHCQSCQVEIPPAWVKVIQKNICPSCEGPILNESGQVLLTELTELMTKMSQTATGLDAQGLAGWLLSNYTMVKVGEAVPTEFYGVQGAVKMPQPQLALPPGMKIPRNKMQELLRQNQQAKGAPANFKNIVAQIQGEQFDEEIPSDFQEYPEYEEEIEYPANFPQARQKQKASYNFQNFQQPTQAVSGDENAAMMEMAQMYQQKQDRVHPALEQSRLDRLEKQQQALNDGTSKVRRSSNVS